MSLEDRLSRTRSLPAVLGTARRTYLRTRRLLEPLGIQLVYGSYDSPVPTLDALPEEAFDRPSVMAGIDFDVGRQLDFLERELVKYCREFRPPLTGARARRHRYHLRNGTYESVDAELLYAMVRRFAPSRIVELGSGYSTLIIREALERCHDGDASGRLHTYDPYRSDAIPSDWPVTPIRAQDLPTDVVSDLRAGDILFVDTSHTVKLGGDVNTIVLELLPILAPGVIVHFHDIFLPYPYSRQHLLDAHFWSEQYLLQAFLSGNHDWEVLVGAQAVARAQPRRLAAAIPSFAAGVNPGAFWIRRRS